ncbi:anti-sigma factor [Sutcliffiella cohnii]|uniref:anti-sigma factor n=1 Tax=Sutcliffiella cohnii TaxID=33932 RepID=UPI002E234B4A|nr:anti sigma factor C-terminal domain-containing protein [Sutcliffiella cohnii]
MSNWTEEKEKKILSRYKLTLTFKIMRITIAVLLAYVLVVSGLKALVTKINDPLKYAYYADTLLLVTEPNIHIKFNDWFYPEVDSSFTYSINYPIYKKIGETEIEIGDVTITKKFFQRKPSMTVNIQPQYKERFAFYLPEDPENEQPLDAPETYNQWEKLEKVHEGTVAEMAFSMDRYYSMEELLTLLQDYDIHVLWMPLNVGEKDYIRMSAGGNDGFINFVEAGGFGIGRVDIIDEESYRRSGSILRPSKEAEDYKEMYLANLQRLNEENGIENYLLNRGYVEKYYNWLIENDFQVYGAVVTGPVKELLKLRELEGLRAAQVGDVTFWDWYE